MFRSSLRHGTNGRLHGAWIPFPLRPVLRLAHSKCPIVYACKQYFKRRRLPFRVIRRALSFVSYIHFFFTCAKFPIHLVSLAFLNIIAKGRVESHLYVSHSTPVIRIQ